MRTYPEKASDGGVTGELRLQYLEQRKALSVACGRLRQRMFLQGRMIQPISPREARDSSSLRHTSQRLRNRKTSRLLSPSRDTPFSHLGAATGFDGAVVIVAAEGDLR